MTTSLTRHWVHDHQLPRCFTSSTVNRPKLGGHFSDVIASHFHSSPLTSTHRLSLPLIASHFHSSPLTSTHRLSLPLIASPSTPLVKRHATSEPSEAHRRLSSAHHLWQHCCRWSFQPVSPHLLIAMGSHSHGTAVRSLVLAALAALMLSSCAPRAAAIRHSHGLLTAASSTAADHSCVRRGCGANAVCVKDRGVASCVCNVGFAMTPTGCADNCALKACGVNGKCIKDSAGVASCVCNTGFVLQADKTTCAGAYVMC
ncbi:unnamed protein product [Closterium sp. Naga37s-1]|nr:unnamed protein product [Closterium sp. Naga37s-1]